MKSYKTIFTSIFMFILLFIQVNAIAKNREEKCLNIGYSSKTFMDVDIKDAKAALDVWVKEYAEIEGFISSNRIYDDLDLFIRDFNGNIIDFGIVKSLDYLKMRKDIKADLALTHIKGGKKTLSYLLLVRSDSGISNIKDLKGRKISLLKGDDLGELFLNTYLLKNKSPELKNYFSHNDYKMKASQCVLSVFFGQTDACLTSDLIFKTMTELNPQMKQQMKSILSSPEFIGGVNFFRHDYDEKHKKTVIDRSQKLNETTRGRQIMLLFKFDKVTTLQESDLDSVKQLVDEYERYKGKK
jgi:ABC-type phosphate/phosphonate transport system substrate-binding protein